MSLKHTESKTESARRFPDWPVYADDEIAAVAAVLKSGKVNAWTGDQVKQFERDFSEFVDVPYAIALANGTVALELAFRALGFGSGDEVIVPASAYIADATAPLSAGATPVFADVDRETGTITAETIAPLITERTRGVLTVHLGGMPCEMDPIMALAATYKLKVIEDCAQAHGARYRDKVVGSFGDAAAFSFCNDKIISTGGEGGMLLLRREADWARAWSFRDHGKMHSDFVTPYPIGPYRYVHKGAGSNYRMTEMQAAIGRIQLAKLPEWLRSRQRNAERLRQGLARIAGLRIPRISKEVQAAWYKAYVYVEPKKLGGSWSRDGVLSAIGASGIPCASGGCPELYNEIVISEIGLSPDSFCPVARELGESSLMFRVDPALGSEQMDLTVYAVQEAMREVMVA